MQEGKQPTNHNDFRSEIELWLFVGFEKNIGKLYTRLEATAAAVC